MWFLFVVGLFGVAVAADHPCDPDVVDACIDPSTTVDPSATIGRYATVGPDMDIGHAVIGQRAVLDGRDTGPTGQPVGDGAFIGQRTVVGPDASIATDVQLGRSVSIGARLTADPFAFVGYGSVLGDDVTLGSGSAIGSVVTVGNGVDISGVVARGATVHDGAQIDGIVGPGASIGAGAVVSGRVRKGADVGAEATIASSARVGRNTVIGYGAQISSGASVAARTQLPACAQVGADLAVLRGETWQGPMVPNCADPEAFLPQSWVLHGINAGSQLNLRDVTTDPATHDVFVVGDYRNGIRYAGQNTTAMSSTNRDLFVASFAADGTLRWLVPFAGAGSDEGGHLAWHDGALYMSGRFATTLAIDGENLSATNGGHVIARLDPVDGSVIWQDALYFGSSGGGSETDLHATADGVFITGAFGSEVGFGTFNRQVIPNTHSSAVDGFIARLSPTGQWVWQRRIGGTSTDWLNSVSSLPDGTLVVGGHFEQTLRNGNALLSGPTSSHATDSIVMLVEPTTASVLAHQVVNSTSTNRIVNVTATSDRIVANAYYFGDTLTFGPDTLQNPGASGSTFEGSNLAMLIMDLSLNPVRAIDAPADAATGIIPADMKTVGNDVVMLASFSGVGTGSFGSGPLTAPGVLIASMDPITATWNWGRLPGTGSHNGRALATTSVNGIEQLLVTGKFIGASMDWDGQTLLGADGDSGFVANLRADGT